MISCLILKHLVYMLQGQVVGFSFPGKEGYHLTEDMADQVPDNGDKGTLKIWPS